MVADGDVAGPRGEQRMAHRFELVETVVIALAAVLTAWAAFQATKWGGVQADSYSRAAAERVESTRISNASGQHLIADTEMFTTWVDAIAEETRVGQPPQLSPVGVYQPTPGSESGFLYQRFRDEFRPVLDAWLATHPLVNPDAPPSPFTMPQYESGEGAEAKDLERAAERYAHQAREANQNGDNYVLLTVLFAMVLVLAGLAGKMATFHAHGALLALAVVVLVVSAGVLLAFPVEV